MTKKKHIGQIVSFRFGYLSSEKIYSGYVVDYNDDWTLLKYNPVDYVRDGYIILRNKCIKGYKRDKVEKFHQKVLDLKGEGVTVQNKIPIDDIKTILNYLTDNFGVFQFDLRSEVYCYLGRVKSIVKNTLTIDFLDTNGKWSETRDYKLGNIRTIQFDTDYINSLKMVADLNRRK
ncbi:hypothetical protein GC194_15405 [bacterium]|nr:hypothetical protein [bacterium]